MKEILPVDMEFLVTRQEFESYLRPIGKPLVIKGWMAKWAAMEKWTFDYFKETYPDDLLRVSSSIKKSKMAFEVRLTDFIDYIQKQDGSLLHKMEEVCEFENALYTYSYKPFDKHPELLKDFHLPAFVDDWFPYFQPLFRYNNFPFQQGWLLIGPKGTVSEVHQDSSQTITWLAQIQGRKRCLFFSPEEPHMYNGDLNVFDPDYEKCPDFKHATAYECILEPGSMVFLPPNWWHAVVSLEPSITLSYNLVNNINFGDYMLSVFGNRVPDFLAALPGDFD